MIRRAGSGSGLKLAAPFVPARPSLPAVTRRRVRRRLAGPARLGGPRTRLPGPLAP